MQLGRIILSIGVFLVVVGLFWPYLERIGLGKLPGDIRFESGGNQFYFPIVSCIVVSVVLSIIFRIINYFR